MLKTITRLFIFAGLLLAEVVAIGQDPYFAGVQDMNIWYNPALKTNKLPLAFVSIRNVKYPNIISYSSKAATIELPLTNKEGTDFDNVLFANLAAGISTDNSSEGFMKASSAMLALSLALPLNYDNTYIAMGFHGNYSFNQVGTGISNLFPDDFDKYGALNWAMRNDPYQTGSNYGYFTSGVGVALFHSGEQTQWYIGGSIRHFNHPYTEWSRSARLSSNNGIQIGYTSAINNLADISGYGNFTWQGGTNEQIIGARYIRHLSDSTKNSFSVGLGYRAHIALIPDASLQIKRSRFSFYYEINVSYITSRNYGRRSVEFSYRFNL